MAYALLSPTSASLVTAPPHAPSAPLFLLFVILLRLLLLLHTGDFHATMTKLLETKPLFAAKASIVGGAGGQAVYSHHSRKKNQWTPACKTES